MSSTTSPATTPSAAAATPSATSSARSNRHRRRRRTSGSSGRGLALICGLVALLVMADIIAATMAMPALAADRIASGASATTLAWLPAAGLVPLAALLPLAGRLADRVGHRRLLIAGLSTYAAGAIASTLATAWPLLLAGRILQGIGAAAVFPAALALLLASRKAERRAAAVALWHAAASLGAVALHAGGEHLLAVAGWRALFGALAALALGLLAASPLLPASRPAQRRARLDLLGTVLLAGGLATLVLAVLRAPVWGWASPLTLGCAGAALALLAAAVAHARHHPDPALDLSLWRLPGFAAGWSVTLVHGTATFGLLAMLPRLLGEIGMPLHWLLIASLGMLVASRAAGPLLRLLGVNGVTYAAAMVLAIGCLIGLAQVAPHPASAIALALIGIGLGALATAGIAHGSLAAPAHRHGTVIGALSTARMMGGSLGIAASALALDRPVLGPPQPGYATVLAGGLLLAALIAGLALIQATYAAYEVHELALAAVLAEVGELRTLIAVQQRLWQHVDQIALRQLTHPATPRPAPTAWPPAP
ncbi:MFS transporter [Nonomuraea sp. NPDC050536]|uniref:MFS transporter n=1 Tax=Nonomuraea sp. NPDC050536 TaxID=3364366 RepID=UPI0037CC306A